MKSTKILLILLFLSCIISFLLGRSTAPDTAPPHKKNNTPSNVSINSKSDYRELEKEITLLRQQLKKAADNKHKINPIAPKENPSSFNPSLLDSLLITNNKTRRVKETVEQLRKLFVDANTIKQMILEKIKSNPGDFKTFISRFNSEGDFTKLPLIYLLNEFEDYELNELGLTEQTEEKFESLFRLHIIDLVEMNNKKPFNAEEVTALLTTVYSSRIQMNPAKLDLMKAYIFETAQALDAANIPPAWLLHENDRYLSEADESYNLLYSNKSLWLIAQAKKRELLDRLYYSKEFYITKDSEAFNSAFEIWDDIDNSTMHECRSMNSLMGIE